MSIVAIACPRCQTALPIQRTVCPRCRATVLGRLGVTGPIDAVRPLVTRIAVGHGLGPDSVEASRDGVVFAGSAAAMAAVVRAAQGAGHATVSLPASATGGRGSRRRLALAAAVAIAAAAWWLVAARSLDAIAELEAAAAAGAPRAPAPAEPAAAPPPPSSPPTTAATSTAPASPAGATTAPPADTLHFAPAVVQAAVRSTVHIVAGRAIGSGVIVSSKGLVLTNAHVVGAAETVEIKLHDGRALPGAVIANRRGEDLALVAIEAPEDTSFDSITIGNAMTLGIGDPIFIVGSPHGHDFSVNRGFVSNTLRWLARKPCVQLDVPINPGNSGGPLLDRQGRLVGINTYKGAEAEGVGYAQMIERARTGPEAILAPHLGLVAYPPAFAELMNNVDTGRPELMLPKDVLEQARSEALATTGVLMTAAAWYEPASGPWVERCLWRANSSVHCRTDVIIAVMALTRRGVRPAIDGARLHLVIGGEVQDASVTALDRGWRSHLLQDPEALARFDALGAKLGTELSLWSSTYRYDGFRVAALAPNLPPPFRIVLRYGGRQTSSLLLPLPPRSDGIRPSSPRRRR